MSKHKEVPGIEYLADYSNAESEKCGFDVHWYICHYCNKTFVYDYGKSQRHNPNFCPVCGAPNKPVYKLQFTKDDTNLLPGLI